MVYLIYMNNTLISTIRFGAVLGIALFAFVGEVFAAPTITPVSVTISGKTSVSLYAKVAAPSWGSMPVWFEYGETSATGITTSVSSVYSQGGSYLPFIARVENLNPGSTYYFRAVATEGGVTVYSPVNTVTIPGASTAVAGTTNTGTNTTTNTNTNTSTTNTNVVRETVVITVPAETKKVASATTVTKKAETTTVKDEPVNEVTNANSAAVIGSGNEALPQTLIGWIGLLIALLVIVLLVKMVLESFEHRAAVAHAPLKNPYLSDEDEEEKKH
jgi:hypothetical protein